MSVKLILKIAVGLLAVAAYFFVAMFAALGPVAYVDSHFGWLTRSDRNDVWTPIDQSPLKSTWSGDTENVYVRQLHVDFLFHDGEIVLLKFVTDDDHNVVRYDSGKFVRHNGEVVGALVGITVVWIGAFFAIGRRKARPVKNPG